MVLLADNYATRHEVYDDYSYPSELIDAAGPIASRSSDYLPDRGRCFNVETLGGRIDGV